MLAATLSTTILGLSFVTLLNGGQLATPGASGSEPTQVRLEAHSGLTMFKLGDPIWLDLVFSSKSPGYQVDTEPYTYLATPDSLDITPKDGWAYSHSEVRSPSNLVELGSTPVRVPVLSNRKVVFLKPGHYTLTYTTQRLVSIDPRIRPLTTTNSVAIDILPREEQEERLLVKQLLAELESPPKDPAGFVDSKERDWLRRQAQELQTNASPGQPDEKKERELLSRMNRLMGQMVMGGQKQTDERIEAAQRLAYLRGDDAVRAKVHLIATANDAGAEVSIPSFMIDGLPSSSNVELQFRLLDLAWRDPSHIPNHTLQTALRQANELVHGHVVTDDSMWPNSLEGNQASLQEYTRERSEIVASLPQRTGMNRAGTVYFLASVRPGLSQVDEAQVHTAVVEEFPHMTFTMQSGLLQFDWNRVRDPALAPILKAILDADASSPNPFTLQRLIDIAPQTATPYVLRLVCDSGPNGSGPAVYLLGLPAPTLPEADACLDTELRQNLENGSGLSQKIELAARYGSEALLPLLQDIYQREKKSEKFERVGPLLAYLVRYAPQKALEEIRAIDPVNLPVAFQQIDEVFDALHQPFPAVLRDWLSKESGNGGQSSATAKWARRELIQFSNGSDRTPASNVH